MAAVLPPVAVPALERLAQLSILNIKQTSTGYYGSSFVVFGQGDEVVLTMKEVVANETFRSPRRPFQFDGMDNTGRKLFAFRRPAESILISDKVELFMDDGLASVIHMAPTFLTPIFNINDGLDNPIMRLKGQMTDVNYFQLQTKEKTGIGAVQRTHPSGENFVLRDNYLISVPVDLAIPFKIAVIVACVYIDFKFHEGK
ncbi:hypothetical protein PYW08_007375 [Mythimna loreyi]|uniref:Uncharacterized protein n=1 Tax=Mythimna loreyi TaxID=667449 RepID=A0ACC2RBF1_9NEOP|nr:hypothetical protein PYW08_007375 [Mythimna loreyi]